jgi:hypothetical protein
MTVGGLILGALFFGALRTGMSVPVFDGGGGGAAIVGISSAARGSGADVGVGGSACVAPSAGDITT